MATLNFYSKEQIDAKIIDINSRIAAIHSFELTVVEQLPSTGQSNVIYLLPKSSSSSGNGYDEYIYVNNAWELVGSLGGADLANYYTKGETNNLLAAKADASTTYSKVEVDNALALKANASSVYTKTQVDTALDAKANASTTYSKTEVDTLLGAKQNTLIVSLNAQGGYYTVTY